MFLWPFKKNSYIDGRVLNVKFAAFFLGMAFVGLLKSFPIHVLPSTSTSLQQVRYVWPNALMVRDVKRRRMNAEYYFERLRVNSLRKNNILPPELIEIADQEIAAFPLNSTPLRINKRCAITSRPRGVAPDFRLSRIVWRDLADHNRLSGVQRAMWNYTNHNPFRNQVN